MKLLDSNTVIHYMKGRPQVVERLKNSAPHDLMVPSVVAYELNYGTFKNGSAKRKASVGAVLAALAQAPFNAAAAVEAALIRVELEGRGLMIGPMDLLIAGTALSLGAILVTNNTREFSRVNGLRLEDWTI